MFVTEVREIKGYKSKKKYKVRFDNGTDFILYKRELERYGIKEETELSEGDYKSLLEDIFIPRANARALHLLEKQDRTESNLRTKLRESGYPKEAIDSAIEKVMDYHYIDDRRYVTNYIRYQSKKKSRKRIINELIQKGVEKEQIYSVIDELSEIEEPFDDEGIIRAYLDKHICNEQELSRQDYSKLHNHLLRKGFESDDIRRAVYKVLSCEYDE